MAIGLGRSFGSDPGVVFWQILVTGAVYFMILGAVAMLLSGASYMLSSQEMVAGAQSTPPPPVWDRFKEHTRVPLACLFTPRHISHQARPLVEEDTLLVTPVDEFRFLALHLVTGALSAVPIAHIVQRRKFVLDFTFTIYVLYGVVGCVVLHQWLPPLSLWWWLSVAAGSAAMWGVMRWVTGIREMQDIEIAPLSSSTAAPASAGIPVVCVDGGVFGSQAQPLSGGARHHQRSASVELVPLLVAADKPGGLLRGEPSAKTRRE